MLNIFFYCVKLKSIVIPSSVARIESGVFHNCQQLSSITIPSTISEIGEEVFYNRKFEDYKPK